MLSYFKLFVPKLWLSMADKLKSSALSSVTLRCVVMIFAMASLSGCITGYGVRGPIELVIEVDEANKEDFVVSTMHYVGGHISFSSYKHTRIAKAGEVIRFPAGFLGEHVALTDAKIGVKSRADIGFYIYHPEYKSPVVDRVLPYSVERTPTRITVHLTHWDTLFAEMEEKVKREPEKALEYRVKFLDGFQHHLGGLADNSWLGRFSANEWSKLKGRYGSWVEQKIKKNPEIECRSSDMDECKRKIEEGKLGEREYSYFPW